MSRGNTVSCGYIAQGKSNKRWKGYEEISTRFFRRLKKNARARNINVEITIQQIWEMYLKQDRKCALSGLPISFSKTSTNISDGTVSVDRIDSNKDYTLDNTQLVHKDLNWMKQDFTTKEFIDYCEKVYLNNKKAHIEKYELDYEM